jgi:uncharacterized damage-inducible protein DinB
MKDTVMSLALLLGCCGAIAQAQTAPAATPHENELAVAALLDNELSDLEKQFLDAADAMPDDKYNFKPTIGEFEGVLTFGEQVKHVAFYNYATFAIMLGEKPPPDADASRGPDAIRTKADILTYARNSFAGGHRATAATRIENLIARMDNLPDSAHGETRLQMMMFAVRHGASHYGQMVEYLRMNGIVPPASRRPGQ